MVWFGLVWYVWNRGKNYDTLLSGKILNAQKAKAAGIVHATLANTEVSKRTHAITIMPMYFNMPHCRATRLCMRMDG